jgi:biopolymer transport protein ExbD
MAMQVGPAEGEDEVVSAINTTPLVDVMLVLLIIFLITIPVVTHTIPVKLPPETNQALQTKPQNIVIAVTKDGDMYWDQQKLDDIAALKVKLKGIANQVPQPEVHIRGDMNGRYEFVGRVVVAIQQSGIFKIAFITQPPPKGG